MVNEMSDDYSIGNYEKLKAENERLRSDASYYASIGALEAEIDTLRKQLDDVRKLLNGIERGCLLSDDDEAIDRWLEANK